MLPSLILSLVLISHRIATVPVFPGLRRFPEGRGFKQWTGDDSKALMKVCIAMCLMTSNPNHSLGLSSGNHRARTFPNGPVSKCFHGVLLSCTAVPY